MTNIIANKNNYLNQELKNFNKIYKNHKSCIYFEN